MLVHIAMKRRPQEIIAFLDQCLQSHIKYCDAKAIRFDLELEHVISKGQRQQLDSTLSVADANNLFYQFLYNDPSPVTLAAAAKVLKKAPNTTNMNKAFAKVIEDFLHLEVTSPGGYSCVTMSDILNFKLSFALQPGGIFSSQNSFFN